jgi:RHS repeat-associated protein
VIYENGSQKLLLTEEGYIDLIGGNAYYYYLKDHQGNNRVVVSSSGTVMETNHYYPFGSTFTSTSVQPYKYNGKELDTKNALNWYDYGARHYDAALGRWFVVDPLSEERYSNSAYSYTGNNPINKIDPNGMLDDWVEDREGYIYWDKNAISQATTKEGEKYLGKTVVVFEGSTDERLGKNSNINDKDAVTAKVTLYNSEGEIKQYKGYTMSSDPKLFGVVADGYYNVNRIGKNDKKGPYGSEWTLNKRGEVPAMNDYNPAHSERKPGYLIGVFIHRPNNNGFAGTYWDKEKGRTAGISEGCLLIAPHQWNDFQNQLIGLNKFKLILNRK